MDIGTTVTWTHTQQGKRTISMRLRTGVIEAIHDEIATIKLKKGQRVQVPLNQLLAERQKTWLTEFVETVAEASHLAQPEEAKEHGWF